MNAGALTIVLCPGCNTAHTLEQAIRGKDHCVHPRCPMLKVAWTHACATIALNGGVLRPGDRRRMITWRVRPVACCVGPPPDDEERS